MSLDLPNVRDIVDSTGGPLRKFYGDLLEIEPKVNDEYTTYIFKLTDMEVIESVMPFLSPTYEIRVNVTTVEGRVPTKKSKWGVLGDSIAACIDATYYTPEQLDPNDAKFVAISDRKGLGDLVGKRLGFVMTDGKDGRPDPIMGWDGQKKEEVARVDYWQVFEIQDKAAKKKAGKSKAVNATKAAMELLNGLTAKQFAKAAMKDDVISDDADLLDAIATPRGEEGAFLDTMIDTGQFTVDEDGVYTATEADS